jgi:hypothetical protein
MGMPERAGRTGRVDQEPKHPTQPIVNDSQGVRRFKANKILKYLFENGNIDLNQIGRMAAKGWFSDEDQVQLAQLIGYSVSGFGELSYVSDEEFKHATKGEEDP